MQVLFEDKHIICAIKPTGVLSEDSRSACMPALLREHTGRDYIGTVHRLDRDVGGVMLFSKNPAVTGKLIAQVAERSFHKEYLAVAMGEMEEESAVLKDLLFRDSHINKSYVVDRMRKGVRDASLEYKTLGTAELDGSAISLLHIILHTGRTHQIRVQLSHRKHPLIGDVRYGGRKAKDIALWSHRICFTHPLTKKLIDVSAPPPESSPWVLFDSLQK